MTMTGGTTFTKVAVDPFDAVPEEPGAAKSDPILVADDVTRRFGGLTAVNVGHFEIQRGAITALIGPNGAGKTTFFNVLTGFDRSNSGTWAYNGEQITGLAGHKIARRERFNLPRMRHEFAGTLSGGQRKLWERARALRVQPQLIILDEPMAGV